MRKLVAAGIFVESEKRLAGRRYEKLYRLTDADRKRISKLLDEVESICTRRGCEGAGRLQAVTLMMVPLGK